MLPPLDRLSEILSLFEGRYYFLLHAALNQFAAYLDHLGRPEGWMPVFDESKDTPKNSIPAPSPVPARPFTLSVSGIP